MSRAGSGASSSGSFIGNLRVLKAPAGFIPRGECRLSTYIDFKPENYEFEAVKLAIHLGLSMLESHRGRQILAELGVEVVDYHRRHKDRIRYTGNSARMDKCVTLFLDIVRRDFFNIYLTDNVGQAGGAAEAQKLCSRPDIGKYETKRDGGIKMCKMIIENIADAARILRDSATWSGRHENALKNFRTGIFQMGFATAHELVHKWVGYLNGGHVLSLPGGINPGCFWETRFLGGGLLGYMEDISDPLGPRQAGKIYLFTEERSGEEGERARELDYSYVERILNFDFNHAARAALNAPVIRRPRPEKLMESVRLAGVPYHFEFAFNPEHLCIMNRMKMYTVSVRVPVWLSRVR